MANLTMISKLYYGVRTHRLSLYSNKEAFQQLSNIWNSISGDMDFKKQMLQLQMTSDASAAFVSGQDSRIILTNRMMKELGGHLIHQTDEDLAKN